MTEPAKKIKVLHLIHTLGTGGAQKVIVNLIRGIDKTSFEISTACMQAKGPVFEEIRGLGAKVLQIPKGSRIDLTLVTRLRNFMHDGKFDIVHTHNFSAGLWGRMAALGLKSRHPFLVHTEHGRRGNVDWLRKKLMCELALKTDAIISVSDETRDYLINYVGQKPDNIHVIRNGIDLDYLMYHKDARVKEIETILKCDPGARFIVNVSALSAVKDHPTLLEAFKILIEKQPSVYLLLVGDGSLRLNLQKLAMALEIDDHVLFMGERHDVAAILGKSDIFALSSRNEGHPISLLEAMGIGVVPVTTEVGGIPELIENAVNGLMVPMGDPSLLAKALRVPLEEKKLAEEWSRKSRDLIQKKFTAVIMAKQHEALYSSLMQRKNHKKNIDIVLEG